MNATTYHVLMDWQCRAEEYHRGCSRFQWGPAVPYIVFKYETAIARHNIALPVAAKLTAAASGAGEEYERLLNTHLQKAGLPFWSEQDLRVQGFVKTPDVKLQVTSSLCTADAALCALSSMAG